jgi:hypothetical protein
MKSKRKLRQPFEHEDQILHSSDDGDVNLLGVFSILLDVAKRTNPEKYLTGYKKND